MGEYNGIKTGLLQGQLCSSVPSGSQRELCDTPDSLHHELRWLPSTVSCPYPRVPVCVHCGSELRFVLLRMARAAVAPNSVLLCPGPCAVRAVGSVMGSVLPHAARAEHSQHPPSPTWRLESVSAAFAPVNTDIFALHPCLAAYMMNGSTGVTPGWYQQRTARIANSGYKCWRWAELMDYYILHMSGERWEQQQAYSEQGLYQSPKIWNNSWPGFQGFSGIFIRTACMEKESVNLC